MSHQTVAKRDEDGYVAPHAPFAPKVSRDRLPKKVRGIAAPRSFHAPGQQQKRKAPGFMPMRLAELGFGAPHRLHLSLEEKT